MAASWPTCAADTADKLPDGLLLKDGTTVRGLILKNTRDAVVMQQQFGEKTYPKSQIVRIYDEPDIGMEYTDIERRGDLPAWRIIANDLRTRDAIRSLVQIPSTVIDNGVFKNVPYLSFRLNEHGEFNIYGDPEDPAGIEIGVYGSRGNNEKLRKVLRSYLAGFLTTRDELRALYSIDLNGGIAKAGDITVEITPRDAPDAYGAWWISLYNEKELNRARLSDAAYARLVVPVDQVTDRDGRLVGHEWTEEDLQELPRAKQQSARAVLRGFYRDKNGEFRVISSAEK